MSDSVVAPRIDFFRSKINDRRFDEETLRILESVLISKDVKSLVEVRSSLREFMRSESLSVLREIAEKPVEQKLWILEFFVRAFAFVGDVESCLALQYEGLVLRELKSTRNQGLQVSFMEWLNFAEQSLDNGFYIVAGKACESAELCLQSSGITNSLVDKPFEKAQLTEKIKRLKDRAVTLAAAHSVQAQATEYLKKKTIEKGQTHSSVCEERQVVASTLFRNGIKRRYERKLHESQTRHRIIN